MCIGDRRTMEIGEQWRLENNGDRRTKMEVKLL